MSTHTGSAYRAHDNAALAARGAVRNPWQRGARSTTPIVAKATAKGAVKGAKGQPKPAAASKPASQPATPRTGKPNAATPAKPAATRVHTPTLNTVMRFTPETVHPAFMHDNTLAALEQTWKQEMEGGRLPVADGLGHQMEVSQARLLMSQAKYLTDAMPWLRESLARIAPSSLPDVKQFVKQEHVTGTRGALMYTAGRDQQPDARKWIVMGKESGSYKAWQQVARSSSHGARPHSAGRRAHAAHGAAAGEDHSAWMVSARTPAGVLTHEFGHVAAAEIGRNPQARAALDTFARDFAGYFEATPTRPATRLSQYAKTDWQEGFAEGFAALVHGSPGQKNQPMVQEVARIVNLAHPNTFLMPAPKRSPQVRQARRARK